jgi:hypothetical protein
MVNLQDGSIIAPIFNAKKICTTGTDLFCVLGPQNIRARSRVADYLFPEGWASFQLGKLEVGAQSLT